MSSLTLKARQLLRSAHSASNSLPTFSPSPATYATTRLGPCTCSPRFLTTTQRNYSSYPSQAAAPTIRKKRTILDLHSLKSKSIPITMLTAHDYPSARFIEASSLPSTASATSSPQPRRGVDICLVGDSLAMVSCGYSDTTKLTLDELLYHCRSVERGCKTSLLIADMPFGTTISTTVGLASAVRLVQEGNMDAVKIEGGEEVLDLIVNLTQAGIPVMAHTGLTPQRQSSLSGYRVQGKTASSAFQVYQTALALEAAGAFALLIEAVPARLAAFITSRLSIPTIGIGAGVGCDGQVLVQLDMMGVNSLSEKGPRFLKKFGAMEEMAVRAVGGYVKEVRERTFPGEEHGYPMEEKEWQEFEKIVREVEGEEGIVV